MKDLNLIDILRAQNIKRWIVVNCSRSQSLAEHTFNVMAITREICRKLDRPDENCLKYAFDHDLDEIVTGDIPTPGKLRLAIGDMYHGSSRSYCSKSESDIVKIADIIESVIFIDENGVGRHASEVGEYIRVILNDFLKTSGSSDRMYDIVQEIFMNVAQGEYVI